MTDPPQSLTFISWVRPSITAMVTSVVDGRGRAEAAVSLTESGADGVTTRSATRSPAFLLAGPRDVTGLLPGAVVRRYPAPGTVDHESNRCPYVELADPTLPWRYTPAPNPTGAGLHPWLVLVVGTPTELALVGGEVTIAASAQQDLQALGDPGDAHRFAHVQQDATGHRVARILSGRPLAPATEYVVALVPAFDASGARSWTGAAAVTVPAFDSWTFQTAVPAGSFENLAAQLTPGPAPSSTGRAALDYPRLPGATGLRLHGALVAPPPDGAIVEDPLPTPVADDLAGLLDTPATDERGRPFVRMPRYGDAWNTAATPNVDSAWATSLNGDPRRRGIAGLGLEVAIRKQEELVGDVLDRLGALHAARQRIRHLALGLEATRSLWRRRVPAEPAARLWLLGPALNRLVTDAGVVGDLATADARTVARGTFSAAARRILRAGPARTGQTATTAAGLLASVNRPPPAVPAASAGLPLDAAALQALDQARHHAVQLGRPDDARLVTAATELANRTSAGARPVAEQMLAGIGQAIQAGRSVPWASVMAVLTAGDATTLGRATDSVKAEAAVRRDLGGLRDTLTAPQAHTHPADDALLTPLLAGIGPLDPGDPVLQPIDVDALAEGVTAAFDPTGEHAPAAVRVLSTISGGVDGGVAPDRPLAPPEPCLGLDRPAWADLAAEFPEWLLPGLSELGAHSVVGLASNPGFVDAYLAGLNTQLLGELRWRNIPVATGCTPVRRFFDRVDTATGTAADDIVGLASWPRAGGLGDATHRPTGAGSGELVIAVRGELLLRYPTTLIYLLSAVAAGASSADFDRDPPDTAERVLPGFRGRLGPDTVFFGFPDVAATALPHYWLAFEEPPAGYRFANDVAAVATSGEVWAVAALVPPVRVLIAGSSLVGGLT